MRVAGFVLCSLLLSGPAAARDWKVSDTEKDPKAPEARIQLKIEKSGISVIRESDKAVLHEIAPTEVMAIWYDDRAIRNYGRAWWDKMDHLCHSLCGGEDISIPLTLMAMGGVGYLAAIPFEEHRQFVNIQYRRGDSFRCAYAAHKLARPFLVDD